MIPVKNLTIKIYRSVENNEITTYEEIKNNIDCFIYPLSEDVIIWNDDIPAYQWYKLLLDKEDILLWDKIIDNNNEEYIIRWVKQYDNIIDQHTECILIKNKDE